LKYFKTQRRFLDYIYFFRKNGGNLKDIFVVLAKSWNKFDSKPVVI